MQLPRFKLTYELKFSRLVGTCSVPILESMLSDARADIDLKCSLGGRSAFGTTFSCNEHLEPYEVYEYLRFAQLSDFID